MATVKRRDGVWHSWQVLSRAFDAPLQLDFDDLRALGLRVESERELAQHYYAGRSEGNDMS